MEQKIRGESDSCQVGFRLHLNSMRDELKDDTIVHTCQSQTDKLLQIANAKLRFLVPVSDENIAGEKC